MASAMRPAETDEVSSEKEISRMTGVKRTASIASLFDRVRQQRHKQNDEPITIPDVGSLFPRQKPRNDTVANNPHYQRFAAAVNEYRQVAPNNEGARHEQVTNRLIARFEGVDLNGKSLGIPGTPVQIQRDFARIKAQNSQLARPLGEYTCPAEIKSKDGTVITENVPLATTMGNYSIKVAKRKKILLELQQQLEGVRKEIVEVVHDIRNDGDGATATAVKTFTSEMEKLTKKVQGLKKLSLTEIKDAQKEDHAQGKERTAKIQQFLQAL